MDNSSLEILELNNGQKIPSIGLGFWQGKEGDEDIGIILNNALEAGYRHFDTAFFYQNEKAIGQIFQNWLSNGRLRREDLFIVSKLPPIGMWPYRVNEFLKLSLRNLGIDYVDLYLIQFPVGFHYLDAHEVLPVDESGNILLDNKINLEAIWKAMEHEVRRRRTKSIGLCNFNETQLERILRSCTISPAILQMEANLYFQQKSLKKLCQEHNIRISASSPLGQCDSQSRLEDDSEVLRLSLKYTKSTTQILLRFLIQSGIIVVQKNTGLAQLTEKTGVFDFQLDLDDMKVLETLVQDTPHPINFGILYPGVGNHPEFPWKTAIQHSS